MERPKALAHTAIYDRVEEILRDEPRGELLDVPSGEGALAERLAELGFAVTGCDLYPQNFRLASVLNVEGDLNSRLPFDEGQFDHVVCVEGLEHIENPANAIREFARIIRSSGTLVVSVPNIMNIEERLKWLLYGYTSHFKPLSAPVRERITEEFGGMEEVALHVVPIGYSMLRYLLEINGFSVEGVYADKKKKNTWAYWPIVSLIRLAAKLNSAEKRRERWSDEMNSDAVLTGGNTLIFRARKI